MNYETLIKTKYMIIFLEKTAPKTAIYRVESNAGDILGYVKWWSPWRQYCYFPSDEIVMASSCLRELCEFIDKLMDDRRTKKWLS